MNDNKSLIKWVIGLSLISHILLSYQIYRTEYSNSSIGFTPINTSKLRLEDTIALIKCYNDLHDDIYNWNHDIKKKMNKYYNTLIKRL